MKKTIIIIAAIISLTSCSKENMISKSEDHLKKVLLDEKSYELIESKVDTVRKHQNLEIDAFTDSLTARMYLDLAADQVDYMRIWSSSSTYFGQSQYESHRKSARTYLDSAKKYEKVVEKTNKEARSIKGTPKDSIVRYCVRLRYYARNKGGDRAIGESTVHVNKKGEPYEITGDK